MKHQLLAWMFTTAFVVACGSTTASTGTDNDATVDPDAVANGDSTAGTDTTGGGNCTLTTELANALDFGPVEIGKYGPNYLKGIEIEAVPCGKVAANDDGTGWVHPPHPGDPFYYKLTKATYLPSLSMEYQTSLAQGGTFAQSKSMLLVPSATATTSLPNFDATKASALVRLRVGAKTVGCGLGKFTLAIDGHPEAKVTYWTNSPDSSGKADATLTAAPGGSEMYFSFTGITPGPLAPFKVTPTGGSSCVPALGTPYPDGHTGNVPLEAGSISLVDLFG